MARRRPFSKIVFVGANGYPTGTYTPMLKVLSSELDCDVVPVEVMDAVGGSWGDLMDHVAQFMDCPSSLAVGHSLGGVSVLGALRRGAKAHRVAVFDPPLYDPPSRLLLATLQRFQVGPLRDIVRSTANRANSWPTKEDAIAHLTRKSPFSTYPAETLEYFKTYGLTEVEGGGEVRLTFPPALESKVFATPPSDLPKLPWMRPHSTDAGLYLPNEFPSYFTRLKFEEPSHCVGTWLYSSRHELNKMHDVNWMKRMYPRMSFQVMSSHFEPLQKPEETAKLVCRSVAID